MKRSGCRLALALLVLVLSGGAVATTQGLSRPDADRLSRKIDLIVRRGLVPSRTALRTSISENEINSYLAVYGRSQLPGGVVSPSLSILGGDRVSGRATIDLDEVRRNSSGGWFDPASYLTGRVPVTAQGVLRTSNGVARLQLESAYLGGVPIPKTLLQEIVTYYSRGPDFPRGVNLDDSFQLPAGIRQIEMRRGEAVVVQQ